MHVHSLIAAAMLLASVAPAVAQVPSQTRLAIDAKSRMITVSADERVSVDPDLAVLHVGFESKISDAKSVYADSARTSNAIVAALKQAGLADDAIRSESQQLEPVDAKNHKFKVTQSWTVKSPPERVGEILDAAINAGATDSGQIEWTVKDVRALENEALEKATARARSDAEVMAKASGARLGDLAYITNQVSGAMSINGYANNFAALDAKRDRFTTPQAPLAIEPHKVIRVASVYAVFAIE